MERTLRNREDVPMVEDFPLVPEDETPEYRDLSIALQLRGIRALEHWNRNTHLTLPAIILRLIEQDAQAHGK